MVAAPYHPSAPPLQHFSLANGLRVYLQEDHRAPLVSVQLSIHVGASHEPAGNSGLSHALEHLVFDGSSKLAQGEYHAFMSRLGASPNAFTDSDSTCFPLTLPVSRLEVALEALADIAFRPTLQTQAFAKVLEIVKAERRTFVDGPALGQALERHTTLCFGAGGYATPVIGHPEDLDALTAEAARHWHQRWYHPNNASVVVVGAIELSALRVLVERHFNALPTSERPAVQPPGTPAGLGARSQTLQLKGLRQGVLMSFAVPSLTTASGPLEASALRLLPALLGTGASAWLRKRLLNEDPVLLNLTVDYRPFKRGDSLLELRSHTNPRTGTPAQAVDRIMDTITAFAQMPVSDEDLQRAKAQCLSSLVFARDDMARQAKTLSEYAICGVDPRQVDQERLHFSQVTAAHVRQAASAYLTTDRLATTLMLEQTDDE